MTEQIFEYNSKSFTTQSDMEREKSKLSHAICEFFELPRESFRLQRGQITLHGITDDGISIPLTNHIGDFKGHIKRKQYVSYQLKTRLMKRGR